MFEKYTLEYITTTKENLYFDKKSAKLAPKDIVKPIIAFANASGGVLAIGVDDDGTLSGFPPHLSKAPEEYEKAIFTECVPPPNVTFKQLSFRDNDPSAFILLIHIAPAIHQIIRTKNEQVYLRMADSSNTLTHSQITQLEYDKGQRCFEDKEVLDSSIDDLDSSILVEYKNIMNVSHKSDIEVLDARGFIKNGHLTNAAILLFGKNPTKFLPHARVRFIRYDGKIAQTGERINIIKEQTFEQAIPRLIPEVSTFIKSQLREFQYLADDGKFKMIPEYPEFAWFEGVVNAVTHRDYTFSGDHIRIKMFDDRLEISSPGKLPHIVTLKNMKNTRYSRNPRIARILTEFSWVKEMNEGVNRIYDEMNSFFLKAPTYSEPNSNSVQLVLENSITSRYLRASDQLTSFCTSEVWESLSNTEHRVLLYLYSTRKITTKEAAKLIDRSIITARQVLKDLQNKNLLKLVSISTNDPNQYYTFKN